MAEARPDKVKALIAVEPTVGGDRNKVALLKNTPVAMVYGDFAKDHPRWARIRQGGVDYAGVLKAAGGSIDIVDLPDAGLKGNSHMLMMDKNNGEIADLIQKWLGCEQGAGRTVRANAIAIRELPDPQTPTTWEKGETVMSRAAWQPARSRL